MLICNRRRMPVTRKLRLRVLWVYGSEGSITISGILFKSLFWAIRLKISSGTSFRTFVFCCISSRRVHTLWWRYGSFDTRRPRLDLCARAQHGLPRSAGLQCEHQSARSTGACAWGYEAGDRSGASLSSRQTSTADPCSIEAPRYRRRNHLAGQRRNRIVVFLAANYSTSDGYSDHSNVCGISKSIRKRGNGDTRHSASSPRAFSTAADTKRGGCCDRYESE